MMKQPKYSFIIPAYKDAYLKEAIDSILSQTVDDWELVVVDDCSPHDINGVVKQYDDPRLSYHRNDSNMGRDDLVASWNHALSFATGEYVVVASDDDVYSPNFLAEAERLIALHPECNLIRGRVVRINERGEVRDVEPRLDEWLPCANFAYHLITHGILCAANYIYKRESFISRGSFVSLPCAWFTDVATAMLMAQDGVLNMQEVTFSFRHSDVQLSTSNDLRVLRQKLEAMEMSAQWCDRFFDSIDDTPLKVPARYKTRLHLVETVKDHMRHIPLWHARLWLRYVLRSSLLYNYEKAEIISARLINLMR